MFSKIWLGLFQTHVIFGRAYFRVMLIFETCSFKSQAILDKAKTPEDISYLKESRIGHDEFEAVSKLWNDPLKI